MRIYISGPYGDKNPKEVIAKNVARADLLARDLVAEGNQVYCPHKMSWHWEDDSRLGPTNFRVLDHSFLRYWAEAIIRIPGESHGSDLEMELAEQLGLVVLKLTPQYQNYLLRGIWLPIPTGPTSVME